VWPRVQSVVLFLGGFTGVAHETLSHVQRPSLLGVFMAMMGLAPASALLSARRELRQSQSPSIPSAPASTTSLPG
jgi:hypothetical protein